MKTLKPISSTFSEEPKPNLPDRVICEDISTHFSYHLSKDQLLDQTCTLLPPPLLLIDNMDPLFSSSTVSFSVLEELL